MIPRRCKFLGANSLCLAWNWRANKAFRNALKHPYQTQESRLFQILRNNASSEYGKMHGFVSVESVRKYQETVPLITYDQLEPWIEEIKGGKPGILTAEPVLVLEKSAGSTAASKFIPYTRSLLAEFRRAIGAWMYDAYCHRMGLLGKGAYWSISPMGQEDEFTSGGVHVGFSTDANYLGTFQQLLFSQLLLVPREVSQISDMEACRYVTLRFLLESPDLGMISVWNPSFLTILFQAIGDSASQLIQDVTLGRLTPPGSLHGSLRKILESRIKPQPRRGRELQEILDRNGELKPEEIWPGLRFISCWTSGTAAWFVPEMKGFIPKAEVQGKGLLATEGVVSVPLTGHSGAAVTVGSHFYEFADPNHPQERPKLVNELEVGGQYSPVITTGGGLYRYDLQDSVKVVGMVDKTPLIEFVGKTANVSDLCGEKLNESWVGPVLENQLAMFGITHKFAMLAPEMGSPPYYVLFLEAQGLADDELKRLVNSLDSALCENFQYAYCRQLGQLGPLRGFRVLDHGARDFMRGCTQLGQRPGAIKSTALHILPGWSQRLGGSLL